MDPWVQFVAKIEHRIAETVGSIARSSATNPRRTLAIFASLCLLCMTGLIVSFEEETSGTELWVDVNSIPREDLDFAMDVFGEDDRSAQFLVRLKNDGDNANVFTKAAFDELFLLHDAIFDLSLDSGKKFTDICTPFAGSCFVDSPKNFWNNNVTLYEASIDGVADPDQTIGQICAATNYPNGFTVGRDSVFNEFRLVGNGTNDVAEARAFSMRYFMQSGTQQLEDEAFEMESKMIELINDDFSFSVLDVHVYTFRSLDDELAAAIGNDTYLFSIAFTVMICFASLSLGKPGSKHYGRVMVANLDVFVIVFASGAAYGLMLYAGIPFQSLVLVLPFLLIGIGIDNAYVMTAGFDRSDKSLPIEERMYETGFSSGMSITVTTLTNVVALLFGSMTKIQAVKWFCYYAVTSFFLIYVAHLTAYVAILTLDFKRRQAEKADCFVCCSAPKPVEDEKSESDNRTMLQRFFADIYTPLILKPIPSLIIVLVFIASACLNAYLATQITTEFNLQILVGDDSYLLEFFEVATELFGSNDGGRIPTAVYIGNVNYSSYEVQEEIDRLLDEILALPSIDEDLGADDWLTDLRTFANSSGNPAYVFSNDGKYLIGGFSAALQAYLQQPDGVRYEDDIIFDPNDNTTIIYSRIGAQHNLLVTAAEQVDALIETQDVVEESSLNPKPFVASFTYQFYDLNRIIVPETVQGLLFALVAVLIICSVMLVHPLSVFICAILLGMIIVNLLGSLFWWTIDLNSVSAINLTMAIGLVIDYSAHVLHFFGTQPSSKSKKERVILTMQEMGPPVLLGACTTFLGVIPLGFASNTIFRTFFRQFVTIVFVGCSHGLVLLPVMLARFGPTIERSSDEKSKAAAVV